MKYQLKEIVDLSMEKRKEHKCKDCGEGFATLRGLVQHNDRSFHSKIVASQNGESKKENRKNEELLLPQNFVSQSALKTKRLSVPLEGEESNK